MKFIEKNPVREYTVGRGQQIRIRDCGQLLLEPDEQVTITGSSGAAVDFTRKDWGYYLSPSLNSRLRREGLLVCLVANESGYLYLLAVEEAQKALFEDYCVAEHLAIVTWLSSDADRGELTDSAVIPTLECPCANLFLRQEAHLNEAPEGETAFDLQGVSYDRRILKCTICNHYFSRHKLPLDGLYGGAYVESTYGKDKLRDSFAYVMNLPDSQSDNYGRVRWINELVRAKNPSEEPLTLLDVGSGLGVFPFAMAQLGWVCTALDPDESAFEHLESLPGIRAVHGDFFDVENLGVFDMVSLVKVLEHVKKPVKMLEKASLCVKPGGLVYVEVPDGPAAASEGLDREEFFIEHDHVFSSESLAGTVSRAGLRVEHLESVVEPSSKFSLRCIARV